MTIKQMEAPICRLCEQKHWARDGCDGNLQARNERTRTVSDDPKTIADAYEQVAIEEAAHKAATPRPKKKGRKKSRRAAAAPPAARATRAPRTPSNGDTNAK